MKCFDCGYQTKTNHSNKARYICRECNSKHKYKLIYNKNNNLKLEYKDMLYPTGIFIRVNIDANFAIPRHLGIICNGSIMDILKEIK